VSLFFPTEKIIKEKEHCGAEQENILQGWKSGCQIKLVLKFI